MNHIQLTSVIGLVVMGGCGGSVATIPVSPHRLSGIVRSADGVAVNGGIVIATDPDTTNEIGVAQVNVQGRFVLESAVPLVALAATTARGWAFVPKVPVGRDDVEVRVDATCTPLHGQIDLDGPPPAKLDLLRIGRLGKEVGDTFAARVDADRRFVACLPPAEYFVSLPPEFAERIILVAVPASAPVHIHAVTSKHAEAPPAEPLRLIPESRAEVAGRAAGSLRVLGLAESNHGTTEFTEERTELAIALAEQHRFTAIMIEAGYGEVLPLDAYIHGAAVDVDAAIANLGYWMWNTHTFRGTLDRLRNYNRIAQPDRGISIVGIDMQTTSGAIDALIADAGLSPQETELLARLRDHRGAAWRDLGQAQRRSLRAILDRLVAARDRDGLASTVNRLALSARSLVLRIKLLEADGFWADSRARDHGMAAMVEEVLGRQTDLRATLWAHLGHLAREYVVGAPSLGAHLARSLGDGYQVYALLAYSGAARGRDRKRELGVIAHALPVAPPYTLEGVLTQNAGTAGNITYWNFERAGRRAPWLTELHRLRSFGATYFGEQKSLELYDLRSIDGAVLFRTVTPSEPLVVSPTATSP
jgi:erythromycin esterase